MESEKEKLGTRDNADEMESHKYYVPVYDRRDSYTTIPIQVDGVPIRKAVCTCQREIPLTTLQFQCNNCGRLYSVGEPPPKPVFTRI